MMRKRVVLVDMFGSELCELVSDGYGFYVFPADVNEWLRLDIGDKLEVAEIETEED